MNKSNFYILIILSCLCSSLFAQDIDWLKNSTSNDMFTSHGFYASTQYNDDFYFAGDFWKDLTIDGVNISIGAETANGFILKMDEKGQSKGLWHFKSDDYVRINKIEVNPISGNVIATGSFRKNLIFNDEIWDADFYSKGFVMSITPNGTMEWIKELKPQNELSFAIGAGLAIDDAGNIFVGIEAGGKVAIENKVFGFEPETAGAVIAKFDFNGNLIKSNSWQSQIFEGWIDLVDMKMDDSNHLVIGGSVVGAFSIADSNFVFPNNWSQLYIVKQDNDLNLQWLKTYPSMRSHVLAIYPDGSDLILSIQYNNAINLDGTIVNGSGSWGDMAILSLDENAELNWVNNFTLSENGGSQGVYGKTLTKWNDTYYVAGMYQGDVVHNGTTILDNVEGNTYQYPFIISLSKAGELISTYDFVGSNGPGAITNISGNETHLLFGGDFAGKISIDNSTVFGLNSTLFYGALTTGLTGLKIMDDKQNLLNVYPTLSSDFINIQTHAKIRQLSIFSSSGIRLIDYAGETRVIDIQDLPSGNYYLLADINGEHHAIKFIKQ